MPPTLINANSATVTNSAQVKIENVGKENISRIRKRPKPAQTAGNHLLRKISKHVSNYYNIVGKHIAVVAQTQTRTNRSTLRIFGSKPLVEVIRKETEKIVRVFDDSTKDSESKYAEEKLFHLPPLVADGVPQTLSRMTQKNLRSFIPLMMKYSTGRGKPGWGKENLKPPWWPKGTPWKSVRLDCRSEESKLHESWTNVLREIIRSCYYYHGREDLLQEGDTLHNYINTDNPDFITYNQSWKSAREAMNITDPTISSEDTCDEIEIEEESEKVEENGEQKNSKHSIIIESNQPCYIYNVPQNHPPIYTIPVRSGAVNVLNVFTTESLKYFANNVANQLAVTEETIDEDVKESDVVLKTSTVESSYGALEIGNALLLNDDQPVENQFTEYNLQNDETEYIFLDDVTGKIEYISEEGADQNVTMIDSLNEEVDFQVEEQQEILIQPQ